MKATALLNLSATIALLAGGLWLSGCAARAENPNRLYFFENEKRAIIVPVTINDSVRVEYALIDTGAASSWVQMDSTFCATHPLSAWSDPVWSGTGPMTGWDRESDPKVGKTIYNTPLTITMCGVDMPFERVYTVDGSQRIGKFDATFSFSAQDTTHVWEMNFRHNYLEAHDAATFTMPDDCRVFPLVDIKGNYMNVRFPVKVTCADGATITIDQTYFIDTGALCDLILLESAAEYGFFRGRDDAVLLNHWNNRRYEVDAEVFDGMRLDAMRVYLNEGSYMLNEEEAKGTIGLNFMKRFNVFFDLSKKQIGFQPIRGFKRTVNIDYTRKYFEAQDNNLITEVLDIPDNPYKKAGVMAGDVVMAINGKEMKTASMADFTEIRHSKVRRMDIIRNGKTMRLIVRFKELGE